MNQRIAEECVRQLLIEGLGLDITDPNLRGTPERIARMYVTEFCKNVNKEFTADDFSLFPNEKKYTEMVMEDNLPFVSMCSHHFLPFEGLAWFLYIPDKWLVGASKVSRCIDHYAARPQLQENLCEEIVDCFMKHVQPIGCMLVMRAVHGCMACRGIKKGRDANLTTSAIRGGFETNDKTRQEALQLILLSRK